jgi:hypothetical protein
MSHVIEGKDPRRRREKKIPGRLFGTQAQDAPAQGTTKDVAVLFGSYPFATWMGQFFMSPTHQFLISSDNSWTLVRNRHKKTPHGR